MDGEKEEPRLHGMSFVIQREGKNADHDLSRVQVIATKFTTNYRMEKDGKGRTVNYSGNHKKSLHLSLRDSLAKLKTSYLDILYVHW